MISRYRRPSGISRREILDRLGSASGSPVVDDAATQIVARAFESGRDFDPFLLEVEDEGTPRRSVDVRLADVELRVGDAADSILGAARSLGIAARRIGAHLESVCLDCLGHLAVGMHRDGRPFLSIHHGVEPASHPSAVRLT
jgi:hypothetical protein